jgi:hypothetical protein
VKVRFTQTLSTARQLYRKGHAHELPAHEADVVIRAGVAVPEHEHEHEHEAKPQPQPAKRKAKGVTQ